MFRYFLILMSLLFSAISGVVMDPGQERERDVPAISSQDGYRPLCCGPGAPVPPPPPPPPSEGD